MNSTTKDHQPHLPDDTRVEELTRAFNIVSAFLSDDDFEGADAAAGEAFKLAAEWGWDYEDYEQWPDVIDKSTLEEFIHHGLQCAIEWTCPYFLNGETTNG